MHKPDTKIYLLPILIIVIILMERMLLHKNIIYL